MEILREAAIKRYGEADILDHFAETSDTLCYATNENQSATLALAETDADLALVVGGYNSSNTMHLVEILEHKFPTYHVRDNGELSKDKILHFNQWDKEMKETENWLSSDHKPLKIALTSGASCPDILVDEVLLQVLEYFEGTKEVDEVIAPFEVKLEQDEA